MSHDGNQEGRSKKQTKTIMTARGEAECSQREPGIQKHKAPSTQEMAGSKKQEAKSCHQQVRSWVIPPYRNCYHKGQ